MDKTEVEAALRPVAREVIENLGVVSERVRAELSGAPLTADSLAVQDEETRRRAIAQLAARNAQRVSELHRLKDEPAVARVVARNDRGELQTYYICRGMPPSGTDVMLASQRAPIGRLASLMPGDDIDLERPGWLEVVENAQLRPQHDTQGWDSAPTVFRTEVLDALTARSLRDLLAQENVDEDFMAMLEEKAGSGVIAEGIKRAVIRQMALRDQPVLDRIQDEIFRLPIVSRLALFGPPGTGKTTTLIRRLGLKLDPFYLAEDEQRLVERVAQDAGREHRQNWLMFTPTPLLKQYVKDAFAREDVAASDRLMKTWTDFRSELARLQLGVLRTAEGKSGLVLKQAASHLLDRPNWQQWYDDFEAWQHQKWRDQIAAAVDLLQAGDAATKHLAQQARALLAQPADAFSLGIALGELSPTIRREMSIADESIRQKLRSWSNEQLRINRNFAKELAEELAKLEAEKAAAEDDDTEGDDDGTDASNVPGVANKELEAMRAYEQVLRTVARSRAAGRAINKATYSGKLLTWLNARIPDGPSLIALGRLLQQYAALRQLASPGQGLLRTVPRQYREFRRERQQQGRWYTPQAPVGQEVDASELDLLLAVLLRRAQGLFSRASVRVQIDQPAWTPLQTYREMFRAQIVVDEATDFSPLQLAAMSALVHPDSQSFFAAGDFHQRLTSWGTRDESELQWAVPGITLRTVDVPYRQSRKLYELARRILEVTGEAESTMQDAAEVKAQHEGYPPVLGESLGGGSKLADWLSERIEEVERNVCPGTSIAVLVPDEALVEVTADALRERLERANLEVQACREGQTIGSGHAVRVFDMQHIKGLEFEAVFLVGLDDLYSRHPDLFDKYLYVGASRAASCLGLACGGKLPRALEPLRPLFVGGWPNE